jgi:hypothetical protein
MTDAPKTIFVMPTRWHEGHGPDIDWTKGDWHTLQAKSPLCKSYTRTDIARKVKPLIWEEDDCESFAISGHGHYVISCNDKRVEMLIGYGSMSMVTLWRDDNLEYGLAEAKAAAQAHHDALIRSALVTQGEE